MVLKKGDMVKVKSKFDSVKLLLEYYPDRKKEFREKGYISLYISYLEEGKYLQEHYNMTLSQNKGENSGNYFRFSDIGGVTPVLRQLQRIQNKILKQVK